MQETSQHLLLSAQRALLGLVLPAIRGVSIDISKDLITVYLYNDCESSNDLQNEYHSASSEIIADFNEATIDEKLIRLRLP